MSKRSVTLLGVFVAVGAGVSGILYKMAAGSSSAEGHRAQAPAVASVEMPLLPPAAPAGMRAVSVAPSNGRAVAGRLVPGSRVDLLITEPAVDDPMRVKTTALEQVLVLATRDKAQSDARGQPYRPMMTMLVTPEQAEMLTLAANEGRIEVVLPDEPNAQPEPRPSPEIPVAVTPPPPPPPPAPVRRQVEIIRGETRTMETVGIEKSVKSSVEEE